MRALLILVLAVGCHAPDGRRYDYFSINDHSLEFLKATHREGVKATRGYLAEDLQFGKRERENRRQRRKGTEFGTASLSDGEMRNFRAMWADLKEELRWDKEKIRHSALFGLLDTGDP